MYITICKIGSQWEFAVWLFNNLEAWDGEGGGREVQEGRDIGIPMPDSCWCLAETNTILLTNYLSIKNKWIELLKNHRKHIETIKKEKNLTHKSASFRVSFHFPICVYHFTFLKTWQVSDEYTDNLRDRKPHIHVLRLIATQTQSNKLI